MGLVVRWHVSDLKVVLELLIIVTNRPKIPLSMPD